MNYSPKNIDFNGKTKKQYKKIRRNVGSGILWKIIGVLVAIIATATSIEPRITEYAKILGGPSYNHLLRLALYIPLSNFFVHGLPSWVWYGAMLAWIAVVMGVILIGVSLWNGAIGTSAGVIFFALAAIHTIWAFILSYIISLTTAGGYSALSMAKIFTVLRPGPLGFLFPFFASGNTFNLSPVTWAVIIIVMAVSMGGGWKFNIST